MTPNNVNPIQWNQSLGYARQLCGRVFRDGGSAKDALAAAGVEVTDEVGVRDWSRAVTLIADALVHTADRTIDRRAA